MELFEIAAEIRKSDELKINLIEDIGRRTVALIAVTGPEHNEALRLAGTGTLVQVEKWACIVTAAHVWHEVLSHAPRIAITITDRINHRFVIDTATIITHGPAKPNTWKEWGPDIILLRIAPEYLGTITAYLAFADRVKHQGLLRLDHLEHYVLMGTPHEFAEYTGETHASFQINGIFMGDPHAQQRDGFDYLDFGVDTAHQGIPKDFGGVSGGGLWNVCFYWSRVSNKIEWVCQLFGVAFHQSPLAGTKRTIRCHGPQTIRDLIESAKARFGRV